MDYSNLNFGQLLHRIENIDIKNNISSYEKIKKRILSAKYVIIFYQICLDEGLYPIFTNIYIYIYMYTLNNAIKSDKIITPQRSHILIKTAKFNSLISQNYDPTHPTSFAPILVPLNTH